MNRELVLDTSDLASRQKGAALRSDILDAVDAGHRVIVNLSKVRSISESYADEAFGVLGLQYGLDWVFDRIEFQHAESQVLRSIASALLERKRGSEAA